MARPPLLAFDLDGTLVDTAPDLIAALNVVLSRQGIPELPLASARNLIGGGARKLIERGLEAADRTCTPAEIDRMMKDFVAYYAEHIADLSRPFDGLDAALDELAAKGFLFAVCTNKLEWLSKLLLDRLKLSSRFAAICGADTFGVVKPDPTFLRQTVARAGGRHRDDHHGRRRRDRRRRRATGQRAGHWRHFRLHRDADRGAQARSGDLAHDRSSSGGRRTVWRSAVQRTLSIDFQYISMRSRLRRRPRHERFHCSR